MKKISAIIITHNRINELQNCIMSIKSQDFSDFEIIIIDNASTDGTSEIIGKNFPEINLVRSEVNLGVTKGRNKAYSMAKGDICVSIDDDAVFKDDKAFKKISEDFEKIENLACISFFVEDGDTGKVDKRFIPRRDRKIITEDQLGASFVGTGHAISKKIFMDLGGFWEMLGAYFGEEPDLSYRILEGGYKILHSKSIVVKHYESNKARPSGRRIYFGTRNTPWIAIKNLPWYCVISLTILAWGYFFLQALIKGSLGDYLKAIVDSISGFGKVMKERKQVSADTARLLKKYSGVHWY